MIRALPTQLQTISKTALVAVCTALLVAPVSSYAGSGNSKSNGNAYGHSKKAVSGHKNKGKKNKSKARMSICHYDSDGDYVLVSLPVHVAIKRLAKNDMNKEPVVGDDGVETCVTVVEPDPTLCLVDVNGEPTTVSQYLTSLNDEFVDFNTDSDSCDIFTSTGNPAVSLYNNADGQGLDIFFGGNRFDIGAEANSEEVYADCAFDIETAAQTNDLCPDIATPISAIVDLSESNLNYNNVVTFSD